MLRRSLCVILLLVFVYPAVSNGQSGREIARAVLPSVVAISTEDSGGRPLKIGSGFFVRDDMIVTNLHVVSGATRGIVRIAGDESQYHIAGILGEDAERDLVLLRITGVKGRPLTIGDAGQVAVGDDVYAVGNPKGLEGTFSPGIISGIRQTKTETLLQITAPISPGSSGGPIVNRRGEVIGVAVASVRDGQNLNFAVPVSYLVPLLAFPGRVRPLVDAAKTVSPSRTEPRRVTNRVIKIATQSPLSGGQAALGSAIRHGAELAIEARGGAIEAAGFRLTLVPFDDQAKPDVGVANAKNIVADGEILLVIGHLNSGVSLPASEVYREADLAMISPANTNPRITDRGYPNVNRVIGRDDVQGTVAAHFAKRRLGATRAYVIHDHTQYGQGAAETFRAAAVELGIRVVGYQGTTEKSRFGGLVDEIRSANPDVVYFGGIYDQVAPLLVQARQRGLTTRFLGPDGFDSSDLVKIARTAAVGVFYTAAAGPAGFYSGARNFVTEFVRRFGHQPAPFAAEAYDATLVGLQAIANTIRENASEQPTRTQIMRAVRQVRAVNGVTGVIEFDKKGDRTRARYFVLEVRADRPEDWGQNRGVMELELPAPP